MNTLSYETITEKRLTYGKYQYIVIFLLCLLFLAEGIELCALTLIMPVLQVEWNIDANFQGVLGTVLFIGFMIGSALSGLLIDKFGRKEALQYISLLQFIIGVSTTFMNNIYVFLVLRGIVGFFLGAVVPLIPTLSAELIPMDRRGKITVIINSLFSFGQFVGAVIGYFTLNSLSNGNWRLMLLICSIPPIIVWYGTWKYLKESPMFVILRGDFDDGIKILNEIGIINLGPSFKKFTENEINNLIKWKENKPQIKMDYIESIKNLFNAKYKKITILMWINWFCITYVFYGIVFILPFFLNARDNILNHNKVEKDGLSNLMLTALGESSSGILAYFLIDTHTFGRKNSLVLSHGMAMISNIIVTLTDLESGFVLMSFLTTSRFFSKMCYSVMYPFIAELYPTNLRILGIGMSSAFGRVASCIMPMVSIKLFYSNIYSPFITYFILSLCGVISTLMIPYDTRGKFLDTHVELMSG
jgi:putative MFS transporter